MLLNLNLKPENYMDSVVYKRCNRNQNREIRVRIIGLGYVSLPLTEKRVDKLLTNMLSKVDHGYPRSF